MCTPALAVGGAMLVMSAATTAYQVKEQRDQAKQQQKLAKQQAAAQERAAKEARQIDLATLDQREEEIEAKGASTAFERVRQAAREAAKLKLSSAEAGVFGTSVFRQMMSSDIQEMHDIGLIRKDTENELNQNELSRQGVEANYQSRMNDADMTKKTAKLYKGPSTAGSMLNIGASGLSGFMSGYTMGSKLSTPGTTGTTPYIPAK